MHIVNPVGKKGEDVAVRFLKKKGYKILARNFHERQGEIDIIAQKDQTLVFVEVKTRTSEAFGTPFEAITPMKLQSLLHAVQVYLLQHQDLGGSQRIDAISVVLDQKHNPIQVDHMENISGF